MLSSLITKSIDEGKIEHIKALFDLPLHDGIDTEVLKYILDHQEKFKRLPTRKEVSESEFAGYLINSTIVDEFDKLIEDTIKIFKTMKLRRFLGEANELLSNGELPNLQSIATLQHAIDVDLVGQSYSNISEIDIEDYYKIEETYEDFLTGFPDLDSNINGIRAGELVIVVGKTMIGKTFLTLLFAIINARSGKKILYFSPEMSDDRIYSMRLLPMLGQYNPLSLKNGYPQARIDEDKNRVLEQKKIISDSGGDIIIPSAKAKIGGITLSSIRSAVKIYKPDAVIIDSAYAISTGDSVSTTDWQAQAEIGNTLKNLAEESQIPIIISLQPTREKSRTDYLSENDIGGGINWSNVADCMLGIRYLDGGGFGQRNELYIIKSRDGLKNGNYEYTFSPNMVFRRADKTSTILNTIDRYALSPIVTTTPMLKAADWDEKDTD